METSSSAWPVGRRVVFQGSRATVRWAGALPGKDAAELWVGVEWDEEGRGKHDGTYAPSGDRLFKCAPGQGSFLKADKVETGVTVLSALNDRYCDVDAVPDSAAAGGAEGDLYVYSAKSKRVPIQLVGMQKVAQKQSRLDQLAKVSLRDANVGDVGGESEVGAAAPAIEELDVGNNLLWEWASVGRLARQLPRLATLMLTGNRMLAVPAGAPDLAGAFAALRVLVLSGTGLAWGDVARLEPHAPLLEELHLCGNGLRSLADDAASDPAPGFPRLRLLNAEGNALDDWAEIWRLRRLPRLERLLLSGNPLKAVFYRAEGPEGAAPFAALRGLSANGCALADWSSIDALDRFPALVELRLQGNPLSDARGALSPGLVRQLVIARVAALETLNGAPCGPPRPARSPGRHPAQAAAAGLRDPSALSDPPRPVRRPSPAVAGGGADAAAGGAAPHPRLRRLIELHGAPDASAKAGGSGAPAGPLSDSILSVTLVSRATEARPVARKLPASMTVAKLKVLMQQLFKVEARRQRLFYRDSPETPFRVELEEELKDLSYYGAGDGGEIALEEFDPRRAQEEAERRQREERAREERQLREVEARMGAQAREHAQGKAQALAAAAAAAAAGEGAAGGPPRPALDA
eukprot:tig00000448_g854.t1